MGESKANVVETIPDYPWHASSKEECFAELDLPSDLDRKGLSSEEASARLQKYGPNSLSGKESKSLLQRIWHHVANVLVGVLVFVAIISAIRAATADDSQNQITNTIQVVLIISVITLNTIIGLIQEGSAEKAAESLKAMLSSEAVVVRDGKELKIPADELVPGDIVKLSLGDRVPADLRLCVVNHLAAQEAALTGESVPIEKIVDAIPSANGDPNQLPLGDRRNMCFSATLISQGSGTGVVVSTGDNTQIGTINTLVNKVEKKKTNVLEQIDTISKWLAFFILLASLGTWCVAFFIQDESGVDAMATALVCAVAMIPEGLEAIVTVTYGWAVSNMAQKNAIIRALPAVETLGSVTVICSDKTGTLTKNEMSLVAFVTHGKRYKFDVDSKERKPSNFVVNNKYLAYRADAAKNMKANDIIKSGPSAYGPSQRRRRVKQQSFPFAISIGFGKTAHGGIEPEEPTPAIEENEKQVDTVTVDISPDAEIEDAESPDAGFLRRALSGGILCSKCVLGEGGGREGEIGNPTELSILRAAYLSDVNVSEVKESAPIIAEVPFSSEYKFMATVHKAVKENDGPDYMDKLVAHVKGAPDRLIPLCKYQAKNGSVDLADLEPLDTNWWVEQIAVLSSHGLRVLALTRGALPKDSVQEGEQLSTSFIMERGEPWLTMIGLCAIIDPPRPECINAVAAARTAGIRVAMITGDHKDTALAIGEMLGLVDDEHTQAVSGPELDVMTETELRVAVQKYNVFARASPQNKIKIVKALQEDGEVCGMTGDGVNDAPALRAADMGVAMGKEGTDVAREAADMILADDNFATIVEAVREGRVVWDNLRKILFINTPINNAQGLSVLFGLLLGLHQSPLTSIQVLFVNLVSAVTLGFVGAIEPGEDGIMNQPPRCVGKRLIGRFLLLRIAIGTIALVAVTVGSVFWTNHLGYNLQETHSQALNTISFGAVSITASARFVRKSAFHKRSLSGNQLALWSYAIIAVLQVFITYCPGVNDVIFDMASMDGVQWGIVFLFAFAVFVIMELEKAVRNYLTTLKYDTDDLEYDNLLDGPSEPDFTPLPAEVNRLGRTQQKR